MLNLTVNCDNIISYTNGKLAIEGIKAMLKATAKVPELIFLDINMPIMDGWEFLEAFIALPIRQKVQINIVTSSIDVLDLQNYERYKEKTEHILSYTHKPIHKALLKEITKTK